MKLTISSVILSVLVASSLVSSAPLDARHNKNRGKKMMGKASQATLSSAAGAAYFLTNEPAGNFVVAASIGSDGKLTLRQATSSDGAGSHGLGGDGPDPLFAQGAVKASAAGEIVAARKVNAGSNTISVFAIDPKNPTNLQMIGQPIGSGGEFPMSVAINKAGNNVCALNSGSINGVACFAVDKAKGTIKPIANTVRSLKLNQTTPATGPAGTASHVIFSEDGTKLIASVKGVPPTPGIIAVWDVAKDGSLSKDFQPMQPAKGGLLPFSMTVIPGKNAILATDAGVGAAIFDLNATPANGVAAGQSSILTIAGQKATCWSSFSQKTKNFYVTDIGTSQVTEISLDNNLKPTIVKQYPQGDTVATIDNDIATVGGNDFMFVLAPNATQVRVLSLKAPGNAVALQTLDIAGPAKAAGLPLNAANLQGMTTFIKRA
ncbi:hypothetical protein MIND_00239100 [Mycena indigotica]|uniref:3-carboxymuconate cyclase n=1 Tax=Mycena indigotica TaxID=2126181 RepID=A0A8H6T7B5_9AGAR|nr:uncharacterized protein MIND_00239100 [Mycena indigotica]KAF7312261.1 hypothetical protein MIND_00239100 [Mycena indigotica]